MSGQAATKGRALVTVAFDLVGRQGNYSLDANKFSPGLGDFVVVESRRGQALGRVVRAPHKPTSKGGGRIRRVLRLARDTDLAKQRAAEERAPELFRLALREFRARRLALKLVAVVPDGLEKRVTYYTVGADLVDSDELTNVLAETTGLEVDIKQLGQRDEAKVIGGLGRCGQELCCSTFLPTYPATSIRQAKDQGMALAADRTAGACGKTLCCLSYEADLYKERRGFLPKLGKRAKTVEGVEGKVIGIDVMRGTFTLLDLGRGRRQVLPAEAWEKNANRVVPPPEFPRTLAAPKTGGLRDRIGNPSSLPEAPAAPATKDS